ncbi:MAG: hypothetical protein IJR25_07995 [Bacteroidales bacterium]|nr:hypothetical protein [Bacteroidales bacterium]
MKRIVVVMMLALMLFGCREKKKVYYETDVEQVPEQMSPYDVDWIGLFIRCHELDSIKSVAEVTSQRGGRPMPPLPDSLDAIWQEMTSRILMRQGSEAFGLYESHRDDIERYLRLDFINYGFVTRVYLPYKATQSTKEEYGEICIDELKKELTKAQRSIMLGEGIPSHYESLLMDLFYAFVNNSRNEEALAMCNEILAYYDATNAAGTIKYAEMLGRKASLSHDNGNAYTAVVSAKQAIKIYKDNMAAATPEQKQTMADAIKSLEDNINSWQKR